MREVKEEEGRRRGRRKVRGEEMTTEKEKCKRTVTIETRYRLKGESNVIEDF